MARFAWLLSSLAAATLLAPSQETRDPAAWGSTHAGQPVPDFVHGDECLFCHRNNIGPSWQKNAHGLTIRQREDAPELIALLQNDIGVTHTLGSRKVRSQQYTRGFGERP
jgi:hypothetical protein